MGISFRFQTSDRILNLTRFHCKTKTFNILVGELLSADDADLLAHSEGDMQCLMYLFSAACLHFGLTITLGKPK